MTARIYQLRAQRIGILVKDDCRGGQQFAPKESSELNLMFF